MNKLLTLLRVGNNRMTGKNLYSRYQYLIEKNIEILEKYGIFEVKVPLIYQFNRANRQFIGNIDAIHKIHPWIKGRVKLELIPKQSADLVISFDKTRGFKEWLDS